MRIVTRLLFSLAFGAYVLSFALPAFTIIYGYEGVTEVHLGGEAFVVCLFNAYNLDGILPFLLWLANPLFWAAVVHWMVGKKGYAALASGLAVLLGIWQLGQPQILVGYHVWLGSFVLLFVGALAELVDGEQGRQGEGTVPSEPPP
jgi:hypothetical protein